MKKRRFPRGLILLCLAAAVGVFWYTSQPENTDRSWTSMIPHWNRRWIRQKNGCVRNRIRCKSCGIRKCSRQDAGHQEYYFQLLGEDERRVYREMLDGIRKRSEEFYLTTGEDNMVDRVYHALLKDHPSCSGYITESRFTKPRTRAKITACFLPDIHIQMKKYRRYMQSMEQAYQEVETLLAGVSDPYEK